jgi:formylglycine-generating enzyme required for sulfatase activity
MDAHGFCILSISLILSFIQAQGLVLLYLKKKHDHSLFRPVSRVNIDTFIINRYFESFMVQYRFVTSIMVIVLIVLFSGCTGSQDITPALKELPEFQQFLKEHPNAKMIITYWSKEEVEKMAQEISQQCDKPITPVAMDKATISDGDLKIVSWINEENQKVVCSITVGKSLQINTSAPTPTDTSILTATMTPTVNSTSTVTQTTQITPVATIVSMIPAPVADQKTLTNSIGIDFILIAAGEFDMGSPMGEKYRDPSEGPVHRVKLTSAFYMGKYEVTQKQWREVMGNSPSYFKGDDLPVEQVSWESIQEFIKKLNEKESIAKYRLPSEAEWEYAARAGTNTVYSFGNNETELEYYGWYVDNSNGTTHPVGMKNPNPWGLYDMHGNVWELAQDKFHSNYIGAPLDGSAWETGNDGNRVSRGGVWRRGAGSSRSAVRGPEPPNEGFMGLGFRLVRDL